MAGDPLLMVQDLDCISGKPDFNFFVYVDVGNAAVVLTNLDVKWKAGRNVKPNGVQ